MNIQKPPFLRHLGLICIALLFVSANAFASRVSFVSVKFFESGFEAIEKSYRVYKDTFSLRRSRYIFAELEVRNLRQYEPHNFHVRAEYFRPDGTAMGGPQNTFTMSPSWRVGHYWVGWGWPQPGNWTRGRHRVDIYINGTMVSTQFFTMGRPYRDGDDD